MRSRFSKQSDETERYEMTDDKSKRDFHDRDRVNGSEDYEVEYFARKHKITPEQVRALIRDHGNNRDELEKAAARMTNQIGH